MLYSDKARADSGAPRRPAQPMGTCVFRGFLSRGETARDAVLRALPKGGVGVEIGVWKGDFSARILELAKPARLHLVDPWRISDEPDRRGEAWYGADRVSQRGMDAIHDQVAARYQREIVAGRVLLHRDASRDAMAGFANDTVDFVYIDGDHSLEAVAQDLQSAFRVTRPGGFLICDDYLLGQWWGDGVVRAVHEFVLAVPVVVEAKRDTQMVLRKLEAA